MKYANLGGSGLKISRIGLGCMSFGVEPRAWRLDAAASRPVIQHALEKGITFFDTADMYGAGESEIVLGRTLANVARRDEVVIATKLFYPVRPGPNGHGLSRKAVFTAIDASLTRLGTDYVDLYQIHRWDEETPIEETMDALNDVVRAGKVRYLGASSMFAWQLLKAQSVAAANGFSRFISVQPHYNLLNREEEREMLPMCRSEGIGVIPWSPLARGRLARPWAAESTSDRTRHDRTAAADRRVVEAVGEIAQKRDVSRAQVSLAWLLAQPGVTAPIVGAGKLTHLDDALGALDLQLDDEEMSALEAPYVPHAASFYQEVPGPNQDR
ncbi:aldo/keto reductase [Agrobacterium rhizogenes]|uniref:aldo/keto reductase n=1 Tax=Rhizobium rhizogenes TaxID=359 RepID=UPI00115E3085|nr:aldo/keto reductase [Rhizobium rhizogenes]NTG90800.1 aldo/keto reductase [Rhizobium rhizogenes]NTI20073.1 aldo/keto reductase [Rhizobium rhizogenes]NTI39463.1 aldo/keto reductase [Rhizobium rhizogenes]TRB19913.1 aldo/keto reductase [Rhizobium rhizogenes]WEO69166.1 aldo/keto reductase [Rhizobium rhizogenes]